MKDPYKITQPSIISFSGGRTSGFMLKKILNAYNGKLPQDINVVFTNTGKEMDETLDFVKDCSEKWDVNVLWLELDIDYTKNEKGIIFYKEVSHKTASRNGEPFTKLLDHWNTARETKEKNISYKEKGMSLLPNPRARFCTDYLKIRAIQNFAKLKGYKQWTNILGLRYDEPRRVHSQKKYATKNRMSYMPMYDAKDSILDVQEFWKQSNFDLKLPIINGETPHGNCDLCFLKSHNKIVQLIKEKPSRAKWWAETEQKAKNVFRRDRPSYIEYIETVDIQPSLPFDDDGMDCFCHD